MNQQVDIHKQIKQEKEITHIYMGKSIRDWSQIYAIYGVEDWHTTVFLLAQAFIFSVLSVAFLLYFEHVCVLIQNLLHFGPASARSFAGFAGSVTALTAVCLYFAAGNLFYSDVALRWDMSQRIVSCVQDWSSVRHALELGCTGRGVLLNAVAMQLKKSGSSGRVVGLEPRKKKRVGGGGCSGFPTGALRTAAIEGVQEYVTCRSGDPRRVPFGDSCFDVVVSAVFLHSVGKEYGAKSAAAAAERARVLGEMVRVLKPGGVGVVWELVHVAREYVQRLQELNMEEIKVSERVTAFMVSSHIVSFRKPRQHPCEVRLDWRVNAMC